MHKETSFKVTAILKKIKISVTLRETLIQWARDHLYFKFIHLMVHIGYYKSKDVSSAISFKILNDMSLYTRSTLENKSLTVKTLSILFEMETIQSVFGCAYQIVYLLKVMQKQIFFFFFGEARQNKYKNWLSLGMRNALVSPLTLLHCSKL